MTRRMYQEFDVYRGHHGLGGDPDQTSVGVPSWTPSLGAADLYARNPSIDGMQPEAPMISSRKYVATYPAQFYEERVNIQSDLAVDLGFDDTELAYIEQNYGPHPFAWEIMNDNNVQEMFRLHGVDGVVYPERVKGSPRVDDVGEDGTIQTFRPLSPHKGPTSSVFAGEGTQVAGNKFVRDTTKGLIQRMFLGQADTVTGPERQANFENWFKQSKAVDADGNPLQVYHGSVHDIEAFDMSRMNSEGDWGAGIYVTSSPRDAQMNYMGEIDPKTGERFHGPDLKGKIDRRAEEIVQELDLEDKYDDWRDAYDVATKMAEKELMGDAPNVMPLHASIQNPVYAGGPNETVFQLEIDENGELAGGNGEALVQSLVDVLYDMDVGNIRAEQLGQELTEYMVDYDGISASELHKWMGDNAFDDVMDDEGKMAVHEALRRALQGAGYDGVIDQRVPQRFDNMEGVGPTTQHMILFDPTQLKSVPGNKGTFDPQDPDLNSGVFTGERYDVAVNKATRDAAKGLLSDFSRWLGEDSPDTQGGRLMDDPAKLTERPSDVPQGDVPRYQAPRGAPQSIAALYEPDNVDNVIRMAMRGQEMGADAWYNLQPLRKAAHAALGAEAGDMMMQAFLRRVAATSPRGAVSQNITRASYFDWRELGMVPEDNLDYLSRIYGDKNVRVQDDGVYYKPASKMSADRMAELGVTRGKDGFMGPFKRQSMEEILDQTKVGRDPAATSPAEAGYGHLAHKAQSGMLSEINASPFDDFDEIGRPKAASFFWNLFGNWEPVTADSHFNRAIGLRNKAGKLKDTPTEAEYEYIERFTQELAQQMGMAPAQLQAAVWMGAGDLGVTPVADPSIWMQMFNKQLDKTAKHRGHSYDKVLHDFLTGKAPLLGAAPFAFLFGALGEPSAQSD